MKIKGLTVDEKKIALGIILMVPDLGESYENALAFGMLPAPLMDGLDKQLGYKWDNLMKAKADKAIAFAMSLCLEEYAQELREKYAKSKAEFVREVKKAVTVEVLRQAKLYV